MRSVEIAPIGRPGIDCRPKQAVKCSDCLPKKINGKESYACENVIFIAKQRKPARELPLESIEKHFMGEIKLPDFVGGQG